jgi:DNA-binding NtrC family response regulator
MNQTQSTNMEYRRSCRKYLEDMIARRDFTAACRYFESIQDIWSGESDIESGIIMRLGAKAFGLAGNLSKGLTLIRSAISILSKSTGESSESAECYIILGNILRDLGKFPEAEKAYRDAESIFRRNDNLSQAGVALNKLGGVHFRRGELDSSLKCLLESIEYARQSNDKEKIAYLFGNIGRVYTLLGKLQSAAENLKLNVELSVELNDEVEAGRAYLSLGYVYLLQAQYEEARLALDAGYEYIHRNNLQKDEVIYLTYLGELLSKTGMYEEAGQTLNEAYNRAHRMAPESLLAARPLRQLAELTARQQNYRKALSLVNKAMVLMKKLNDKVEIGALYRIKAVCMENLGQEKKAEKAYMEAVAILEEHKAKIELADALAAAGKSSVFGFNQRMMYLGRADELFSYCDIQPRVIDIQKTISSLEVMSPFAKAPSVSSDNKDEWSEDYYPTLNPRMKKIVQQLKMARNTDLPILLTGETGVGKDHLAQYFASIARPTGPYIAVNCAALPETLLESELFGYRKGAFTGAEGDRRGLFLAANNGTLLLDEIGDLPPALQAKLLSILETKKLRPLGTSREIDLDILIIAATNQNLAEMVEAGTFRRDLYYRLECMNFELPPLRERKEDIPYLLEWFLRDNGLLDINKKPEPELVRQFVGYHWPGNIRQMENKVKHLAVMFSLAKDGSIAELSRTFFDEKKEEESRSLTEQVERFEKQLLLEALIAAGGNKSEAARLLSIHESTFRAKMKKYGLSVAAA